MAATSKYVGLNTVPDSELIELKAAIEEELFERKKKECANMAALLKAGIEEILSAGCSVIIEDEEDEIGLVPENITNINVSVCPF